MEVVDRVCGMKIPMKDAAATVERSGKTFYFCSEGCRQAFEKEPERYLGSDEGGPSQPHHHGGGHHH